MCRAAGCRSSVEKKCKMGKKDKGKKKGHGAAKTAEKTEKKMKNKIKKVTGEDDIESIVKAIEDEERKRSEVKEEPSEPPSHRANLSLTSHPEGNPELVLFGGEFHDGRTTRMFGDLLVYSAKRGGWSRVVSPSGPPPRSAHQAAAVAGAGGRLFVFGGEYASPSETQFHHYKDLWCFHFATKRWEKITSPGGPSSRSGHRMVVVRRHLVVFGGFHDNLRDCKYFNDVHAFDLDQMAWKKLEILGSPPAPRSACVMFPLPDGRGAVVFGGYCKEKGKKDAERGVTLSDMFVLTPDKNDPSLSRWRWQAVKQTGARPTPRTGMSVAVAPNGGKAFVFGGVQDVREEEEELEGKFYNELYTVGVEGERATWTRVELRGRRDGLQRRTRRRQKGEEDKDCDLRGEEEGVEAAEDRMQVQERLDDLQLQEEESTVTVESGAFTVTSTVGGGSGGAAAVCPDADGAGEAAAAAAAINAPCPRFGAAMAVKQGTLYLFGGMVEDGDATYTLKDLYRLDIHKFEEWETLIESDLKSMEWYDSESEDSDDDEAEDAESEESMEED